jgi:hypothetical protein
MNRPVGMEKPRSWNATNETTYPLGRRGTDSSSGSLHSSTSVSGGSCPAVTRQSSIKWVTLEHDQFDMATAGSRARLR